MSDMSQDYRLKHARAFGSYDRILIDFEFQAVNNLGETATLLKRMEFHIGDSLKAVQKQFQK
jgi:hypothetical protein